MKHKSKLIVLALIVAALFALLGLQVAVQQLERAAFPRKYAAEVQAGAAEFGVDENLIYTIIRTESSFNPNAYTDAGARGLMQITEETFAWIKSKIAPNEPLTVEDLYKPEVNIRFGSYMLSVCLARYGGDVKTVAAAYHNGMGLVDSLVAQEKYSQDGITLHTFPYSKMNHYVNKVSRAYHKYQTLYA